jgi:pantoate kinase
LNGKELERPIVSQKVIEIFRTKLSRNESLRIEHKTRLPSGSGLGTSGAGALSLALALNAYYENPLTELQAGQIAHEAEIACKTGLGTVIADTTGGFEARIKAGGPGYGEILSYPGKDMQAVIAVAGPLSTRQMLANRDFRDKAEKKASELIRLFTDKPTPEVFLSCAEDFSQAVDLFTPRLRELRKALGSRGIICPMLFFGEGVYTLTKTDNAAAFLDIFATACKETGLNDAVIFSSPLSKNGAALEGKP